MIDVLMGHEVFAIVMMLALCIASYFNNNK
jgi:hypothetical protein